MVVYLCANGIYKKENGIYFLETHSRSHSVAPAKMSADREIESASLTRPARMGTVQRPFRTVQCS